MKYIKGLDAVRGIAVLLVIYYHWSTHHFDWPVLTFIDRYFIPSGVFGVDLFFVISGFLITILLLRAKSDSQLSNTGILKTFFFRRALRIFPIYYLLIFALYLLGQPDVQKHIVSLLTYTYNFVAAKQTNGTVVSHTWSLSVEEQFYLIWPFVILLTPTRYLLRFFVILAVGSTLTGFIVFTHNKAYGHFLTVTCINAFAIGGIYSLVVTGHSKSALINRALVFALLPAAVGLLIYITGYWEMPPRIINAIFAVNIVKCIYEKRYPAFIGHLVNSRPLNYIGKISYGLYIYHNVIFYFYYGILHNLEYRGHVSPALLKFLYLPYIMKPIATVMLCIISYLSYEFFEKRLLKLKDRFTYRTA